MKSTETNIAGLMICTPKIYSDHRGYFFESYNREEFLKYGISTHFIQDNQSYSRYGTIRGLHFQAGRYAQAKLIQVIQGKILDVVVDLRKDSATFGKSYSIELSAENNKQLFIPKGCAHGFAVLSAEAIFTYKCDQLYNKSSEKGIAFNDPQLNINWMIPSEHIILSEKDQTLPSLQQYMEEECC